MGLNGRQVNRVNIRMNAQHVCVLKSGVISDQMKGSGQELEEKSVVAATFKPDRVKRNVKANVPVIVHSHSYGIRARILNRSHGHLRQMVGDVNTYQ